MEFSGISHPITPTGTFYRKVTAQLADGSFKRDRFGSGPRAVSTTLPFLQM